MSVPSYPSELPPPLRADYAEQSGEGRAVFRPDAGPPSVRLKFAAVVDTVPFSTSLERWQLGVFDRFFSETLKKGTLPFTMPAPLIDGFAMLDENCEPLLDENDKTLLFPETMLVMFADQGLPQRMQVDVEEYRVRFSLMRLPA
ncbi:hypothetical protein [Shinella sp. BYT-45]|uniref:hypothetical protein n=1 Tax=Shinella sp. BYT-45 TaxID=3377377 RepID=UPI00397FFE49